MPRGSDKQGVHSDRPIQSELDDPERIEELDHFLLGLGEALDWLQESECNGELVDVAKRAGLIAVEAERYGFPELAQMARQVDASATAAEREACRGALHALTDLVRRARIGHRLSV